MSSIIYEGYKLIKVGVTGSGQVLYEAEGVTTRPLTLENLKNRIDGLLDSTAMTVTQVMSQETFDALQRGTIAEWEYKTLKDSYDNAVIALNDKIMIESGGGRRNTSVEESERYGFGVRIRKIRRDLVGSISLDYSRL